jgi:hypothetical protein
MFHADGRWKEFGLSDYDATVFPFWLFCIVWALVSFLIGRVFFNDSSDFSITNAAASVGIMSMGSQTISPKLRVSEWNENGNMVAEEEENVEIPTKKRGKQTINYENAVKPIPPPRGAGQKRGKAVLDEDSENENMGIRKPGYYILNKNATKRSGEPKYIYYGKEPPGAETVAGVGAGAASSDED